MSKYRYLREILREAYPKFKPEQVEKIMKRIKEIRDTEKQKQSS
jgi:5-bromo-4-chloroindolyl phosphate hydrolysis protein